jgi:hypothetical protein
MKISTILFSSLKNHATNACEVFDPQQRRKVAAMYPASNELLRPPIVSGYRNLQRPLVQYLSIHHFHLHHHYNIMSASQTSS